MIRNRQECEAPVKKLRKRALVVLAAGVVLASAIGVASRVFADSASSAPAPEASSCKADQTMFGHIKSLTAKDNRFELQFDPAWFLSGVTASRAALEDTGSSDVPNDNYVVEEGHRLLTYIVPRSARVSVLTAQGNPEQLGATPITVSQLAQLVEGEAPVKLTESLESGVWIRVHIDTVCSLEQQYRP